MNERITIDKPVEIKDNSAERVAFDLMSRIAYAEDGSQKQESSPRDYYLELYHQCLKTVNGSISFVPKSH